MGEPAFRERYTSSGDGLSLYWRDYGDPLAEAAPLLCLTGLTRNSKDFHRLALRHAGRRRVICPDYRGRGQSQYDPDWRNYRPDTYVEDLRHLLAAANVHKVVVIGTSLGGIVAMAMGAAMPTALAGVVLNDVGPEVDMRGVDRIVASMSTDRNHPDWAAAVRDARAMFPGVRLTTDEAWLGMAKNTFRLRDDGLIGFDWDVHIVKPLMAGEPLPDLWPLYHSLRHVPTLAIRGEVSDVLSLETFDRMAEENPNLHRITIPGIGHAPHLGEPEAVAAVEGFLDHGLCPCPPKA